MDHGQFRAHQGQLAHSFCEHVFLLKAFPLNPFTIWRLLCKRSIAISSAHSKIWHPRSQQAEPSSTTFDYLYDMNAIENDYIRAWSPTISTYLTSHNADTLWQHKTIAFFETHHNECTEHLFLLLRDRQNQTPQEVQKLLLNLLTVLT